MAKKDLYDGYDSWLRDDTESFQDASKLRKMSELAFESMLNTDLTHKEDLGPLFYFLSSLKYAAGRDKVSFRNKMKILNVMAHQLNMKLSPEQVEMLVESLRKRLLELIEEAKDKKGES